MVSIEAIVRKVMGDDFIKKVEVRPDWSFDGEPILRIRVVYDDAKREPKAREMIEVTEQLWRYASKSDEKSFPVTDFVSLADDSNEAAAA